MFDLHLHSALSHDSDEAPEKMIAAAEARGLKAIAFTDHYDYKSAKGEMYALFSADEYRKLYDGLTSGGVRLLRGVEFGMSDWTVNEVRGLSRELELDFVIGSVHNVDGFDPYEPEYWKLSCDEVDPYERYLRHELACVKAHAHGDFDVLGHLNYVCKSPRNPLKKPLLYADYRELCDEILRALAERGIGLEINTSGVDRVGDFLPARDIVSRFRELGGEIVTVGSDAHDAARVGQYTGEAIELAREIFGYVCTFEQRRPVFHKL